MPIYRCVKTYKYTEVLEIEAETLYEAKEIATTTEGDRVSDDWLYDVEAYEVSED